MGKTVDFSISEAILSVGGKFVFLIMLAFLVSFSTDAMSINTDSVRKMISNKGLNKENTSKPAATNVANVANAATAAK
jgi:hypothetical protein